MIYLLLLALLLGTGTLTATLLPSRGGRVGLGAILFLALIVDATWIAAPLHTWSAGLADAVWAGVLAVVAILALLRALVLRRRPTAVPWTWPTRRDLAFLLVVIALFGAAVIVLPVPLDTDAQGFGYLALALRDGGDSTRLSPWHPEIEYLYSPAYPGLIAHLSARLDPGIHELELALSAALAVLFVWGTYDLGSELAGPRAGRAFMLAALGGTGLLTAFFDSHYTALLALLVALGFLTFVLRYLSHPTGSSAWGAAICLAAVPLSQPDITIALMIGVVPWLVVIWLGKPRPRPGVWLTIAAVIPLVALGIVAPWLLSIRDLLGAEIESPFQVASTHWRTLVLMHGGIIVLLAAVGALAGLRWRHPAHLLMVVWMAGIVEFSTLGLLEKSFPRLVEPLLKYDYPFSLAWHGPILPYTILGGTGLWWLAERLGRERVDRWTRWLAYPVAGLALLAVIAGVMFFEPLVEASKGRVSFYGAFSSSADVAAMRWLRDHAPEDARILNHPGPQEGDWAPVIAERDTVFFRPQPFFRGTWRASREQAGLRAFWRDPTDPDIQALLIRAGVRYVLVPQVFGDPGRFADMLRWRDPIPEAQSFRTSELGQIPYLRLVYERDGAQVYEVLPLPD